MKARLSQTAATTALRVAFDWWFLTLRSIPLSANAGLDDFIPLGFSADSLRLGVSAVHSSPLWQLVPILILVAH